MKYCVAYNIADQEDLIAKYDMVIVDQAPDIPWLGRIKALNPAILVLGYLNANEDAIGAPGLGNSVMSAGAFPSGYYDFTSDKWQRYFPIACDAIMSAYPFDGLFFDNCSVFTVHAYPGTPKAVALEAGLQEGILNARRALPDKILIGNTASNWLGLNGEMNEFRDYTQLPEFIPKQGQTYPIINMYMHNLVSDTDLAGYEKGLAYAQVNNAWYGYRGTGDYQKILWFD